MRKTITELIQVDTSLAVPVYKQIVQSICRAIENGVLRKDDVLPSVNKISETFSLARGSVFTAYNDLRASGLIDSIPGKGYFVAGTETRLPKKIFLLLSAFNACGESIFCALSDSLPKNFQVDIYFHRQDVKVFESLIRSHAGHYHIFIIEPAMNAATANVLSKLDHKKVYLLDAGYSEYRNGYSGVFQNFEKDILSVLSGNQHLEERYKRLFIISAEEAGSKSIIAGFRKFCRKTNLTTGIRDAVELSEIRKGDAFIVIDDSHLIELAKLVRARQWELGKDIGILSYTENPLKSVIGRGITTITTDFEAMGKAMANLVMNNRREVVENPFIIVDRKSF